MPGRRRSVSAALLSSLLAATATGPLAAAEPAPAAPAATCASGEVTVVVDFGSLGGGIQQGCASDPASGFAALTEAGHTYTTTQRFPGLLCRIDGKPADEPCVNAPPADRYWAYWYKSSPSASWTYSSAGAGNRTPPAGSVEGWAFSGCGARQPGQAETCGGAPAPTTAPPATSAPSAPGATPPPGGGDPQVGPGSSGSAPAVDAGPAAGALTPPSTSAAAATSTTTTAASEKGPEVEDDELAAAGDDATPARATSRIEDEPSRGSPLGVVVAVAILAAIIIATVVSAHRRRRVLESTSS